MIDAIQGVGRTNATYSNLYFSNRYNIGVGQSSTIVSGGVNSYQKISFEELHIAAINSINDISLSSSDISEPLKLAVEPKSMDVFEVTISMAEANLRLSQNVIDRLTQDWSKI